MCSSTSNPSSPPADSRSESIVLTIRDDAMNTLRSPPPPPPVRFSSAPAWKNRVSKFSYFFHLVWTIILHHASSLARRDTWRADSQGVSRHHRNPLRVQRQVRAGQAIGDDQAGSDSLFGRLLSGQLRLHPPDPG